MVLLRFKGAGGAPRSWVVVDMGAARNRFPRKGGIEYVGS